MSGEVSHQEAAEQAQTKDSTSVEDASRDPYELVPLNVGDPTAIRLLEILPKSRSSSNNSTISCRLRSSTIKDKYIALSYMWGEEEAQETIMLNGIQFPVRHNLWDFLRQNRIDQRRNGTHLLWIDALCINQAGLAERNHQVAMMGQIYSQASGVLIWLGSKETLLFRRMKRERISSLRWKILRREESQEELRPFYYHQYWTRAWILQECVLATSLELQCGPFRVTEQRVRDLNQSHWFYESDPLSEVFQARTDWRNPAGRIFMQPYDNRFILSRCSDSRDRVYSKLALMDPAKGVTPDYNRTTVELYKEVASKCFMWNSVCFHDLYFLAVTLNLTSGPGDRDPIYNEWNAQIRDLVFQARIIEDYYGSSKTEEEFFDQYWNDYIHQLANPVRIWLQTSRIGRQQPIAARRGCGRPAYIVSG